VIYSRVIRPKDVAAFLNQQGEADKKAVLRGMYEGALHALPILHAATLNAPPASPGGSVGAVNTGYYRRAWKATRIPGGCAVYNAAPYSPIIEGGRRPGARMPPPRVLEGWVRRRLGISGKEAKGVAFVVARAIAKRGLQARRVLGSSIPKIDHAIFQGIKEAVTGKR
jgi:hypothetical protein